ncbi:MAG TPA: hypothetical protein VGG27_20695 [Magnetospirillaceae bacterium]|jgi:hypothetical protein
MSQNILAPLIFYASPREALAPALICGVLFLVLLLFARSSMRTAGTIVYLGVQMALLGSTGYCLYMREEMVEHPVVAVQLGNQGLWCRDWGFWVQWDEIDRVDFMRGGKGGPSNTSVWLKGQYLDRHPWSDRQRKYANVWCESSEDIFAEIDRYLHASNR